MTITVRQHSRATPDLLEATREGVPTAYIVTADDWGRISGTRNEDARWRLVKSVAKAKRAKQEA